jgi:ribosomal protein RSM22 (predicted rRNA methylase)
MKTYHVDPLIQQIIEQFLKEKEWLKLKRICHGINKLRNFFLHKEYLPSNYMKKDLLRFAYLYYYYPVNIIKTISVIEEMQLYATTISKKSSLDVLDFGCGPGTCSIAFLLYLKNTRTCCNFYLYDKISTCAEEACLLLSMFCERSQKTDHKFIKCNTIHGEKFDIIFAGNVLSELKGKELLLAKLLQKNLQENGYLVIIEPALKSDTLNLINFRNNLQEMGYKINAPCLNTRKCPMHKENAKLWCHQVVNWIRPGFIERVDSRIGLSKELIKYSYLVVSKQAQGLSDVFKGARRVVSSLHKIKGKAWCYTCSQDALEIFELLKKHRASHPLFYKLSRGDIFICHNSQKMKNNTYRLTPVSTFAKLP